MASRSVLYSGYLFKEVQSVSFWGSRTVEKRRRFFILPRVRATDASTKLRFSYYGAPGEGVEKGCLFITPESYIDDITDDIIDVSNGSNNGAAASFGMRMYPQGSVPVLLWADSWEERELWKTAITEGISLLVQKERLLRRDSRKKRKLRKSDPNADISNTLSRRRSRSDAQQHTKKQQSPSLPDPSSLGEDDVDVPGITKAMLRSGSEYLAIRNAVKDALAPSPLLDHHKQLIRRIIAERKQPSSSSKSFFFR